MADSPFTTQKPAKPGFFSSAPRYPQFWLALLPLALIVWIFWSGPAILGAPEDGYTAETYQELDPNAYCSTLMPASAKAYQRDQRLSERQNAWRSAHKGREDYPPNLRSRPLPDLKCQAGYIGYAGCKRMRPDEDGWALCDKEGLAQAQHRFDCTSSVQMRTRCDAVFEQLSGPGEESISSGSRGDFLGLTATSPDKFSRRSDLCSLQQDFAKICERQEYADDRRTDVQWRAGGVAVAVGASIAFLLIWYVVDYNMFIRKYGQPRSSNQVSAVSEFSAVYESSFGHRIVSWLVAIGVLGVLIVGLYILWVIFAVVFAPAGAYS